MTRLHLPALVSLLVAVTGCGDGTPFDPVADYKQFIDGEFERVKTEHLNFALDGQYKMDVQKTDSLVSPLVGTCNVNALYPFESDDGGVMLFLVNLDMKHGYQDGKWVMTTGNGKITGSKVVKDDSQYKVLAKVGEAAQDLTFDFSSLDEIGKAMGAER